MEREREREREREMGAFHRALGGDAEVHAWPWGNAEVHAWPWGNAAFGSAAAPREVA